MMRRQRLAIEKSHFLWTHDEKTEIGPRKQSSSLDKIMTRRQRLALENSHLLWMHDEKRERDWP